MMFVGVDGCREGWVAVAVDAGGFVEARAFERFDAVMAGYGEAEAIGVDMPVGLVEDGARDADGRAREALRGQASSVFSAPVRAVLRARDYAEARRISLDACGKSLSKQAFNLVRKIAEVDAHAGEPRLYEVHPELSFRIANDGERLIGKKTWDGLHQRLALLRQDGIELPGRLGDAGRIGIDDVVDAAIAAWSARRIAQAQGTSFPTVPEQRDRSGRHIAIWA